MSVPAGVRIAAVLSWINGVGFGIFTIPAIRNLAQGRDIPIVLGFPAYGGGPFEKRWGLRTTIPLLVAFFAINVAEIVTGALLWSGLRAGAILGIVLLPIGGLFWWGFALPLGPPLAFVATFLAVLGWSRLR